MSDFRHSTVLLRAALFVLVLASPLVSHAAGVPAVFERTDYRTGYGPEKTAVADFDNDGVADLAVLKRFNLTVLPGTGDGSFGRLRFFGVGRWPDDMEISDLDGDSKSDAVFLTFNSVNSFTSIPHRRLGWRLKVKNRIRFRYPFMNFASGDFNNDGRLDLAVLSISMSGGYWGTRYVAWHVRIYDGMGDGTFEYRERFRVGGTATDVISGDFDSDGETDLCVASSQGGGAVSILYGAGDGSFSEPVDFATYEPEAMASADFDDDGWLDVVVIDLAEDAAVILYGSPAGLGSPVEFTVTDIRPAAATADLNADGAVDLILCRGQREGFVTVFYGDGFGGFGPQTDYEVGSYPMGVTAADLDGDGLTDLAVANQRSRNVSVLLNVSAP